MNPLSINDINTIFVRYCRENNQSWLGRWEDRPWFILELGRRQTEELDQIACETSYTKSGLQALKDGIRDPIRDGRSWCKFNRIKIKSLDVEDHFSLGT